MGIHVIACKADALGGNTIPDVTIEIVDSLGASDTLESIYEDQAIDIVNALTAALPQATLERVMVKLFNRRLSLYRGKLGAL